LRVSFFAPRFQPAAVLVGLYYARVVVAVGDEHVAGEIPRDVGGAVEGAPAWSRRTLGRRCRRFHGFVTPTQHHEHAARWVELHDHVRPFVGRPDVVVLVDPDGVG